MKKEIILNSFLMAFLMSLFMSGLVTTVNTGFERDIFYRWMHTFSIALPAAFITIMILKPLINWLTERLLQDK